MLPAETIVSACRRGSIRVLVVDDDPVYRHIVRSALSKIAGIEVTAAVGSIADAKRRLAEGGVDLITLDVVLKNESGLTLLEWVVAQHKNVLVALLTSGEERRASQNVDAILLGATALIRKPNGPTAPAQLQADLERLVRGICPAPNAPKVGAGVQRAAMDDPLLLMPRSREVVAIGSSTGGPPVIVDFLRGLLPSFAVPILVTQHMLPEHLKEFASMLSRASSRPVQLAKHGERLQEKTVYIAAPEAHLGLKRDGHELLLRFLPGPPENFCLPAVDPMLRSVAETCGRGSIGVIMTGMGSDGAKGAVALKQVGAPVIVQDEATSVVWAMPSAALQAGAACEVVPGPSLCQSVMKLTAGVRIGKAEVAK